MRKNYISAAIFFAGKVDDDNSYSLFSKSCVNGHNIIKYKNTDIQECKALCSRNSMCLAFEYGVAYRPVKVGDGAYEPRDCVLNSGRQIDCDGAHHNLDLYVKGNSNTYIFKERKMCHMYMKK